MFLTSRSCNSVTLRDTIMIGKLDPEENVMGEEISSKRKSAAVMKTIYQNLTDTIAQLGWDCYDLNQVFEKKSR